MARRRGWINLLWSVSAGLRRVSFSVNNRQFCKKVDA